MNYNKQHKNILKKQSKAISEKTAVVTAKQPKHPRSIVAIRWMGDNWRTIRTTVLKDVELGCVCVNPDTDEIKIELSLANTLCVPRGNYIVNADGVFSHCSPDNLMSLGKRK